MLRHLLSKRLRDWDLPGILSALPAGIIGWLLLVVLCLTWMPVGTGAPHIRLLDPPSSPLDVLINLLLFAPIGLVVVTSLRHHADVRAVVIWTAALAAMFSMGVEVGQLRVEGRTVSLFDPVLNTLGATFAGMLALVRSHRILRPTVIFAGMILLVLGTFGASLFLTRQELRLARWDPSFEITAGEEVGGERTYIGQVFDGRVCSGAGGERWCAEPGAGPEERAALVVAAEANQRIELAATVISASAEQSGPARIVTFSDGTGDRNATLGQTADTLILRVRTPRTGVNAHRVEFHLPRAVPVGEPVAVSAVYSPGRVSMRAISGTGSVAAASLPIGVLSSWWLVQPLAGPQPRGVTFAQLSLARVVGAALVFVPLGWVVGRFLRPLWLAAGVAAVGTLLGYLLLETSFGNQAAASDALIAAVAGIGGAILGRRDIPHVPPSSPRLP